MLCSVASWSQAHKRFATRACNDRQATRAKPSMAVEIFFLLVSKLWNSRAVRGPRPCLSIAAREGGTLPGVVAI